MITRAILKGLRSLVEKSKKMLILYEIGRKGSSGILYARRLLQVLTGIVMGSFCYDMWTKWDIDTIISSTSGKIIITVTGIGILYILSRKGNVITELAKITGLLQLLLLIRSIITGVSEKYTGTIIQGENYKIVERYTSEEKQSWLSEIRAKLMPTMSEENGVGSTKR